MARAKGGRSKYDRKKESLIAALLTEASHEQAAAAAGVGLTTLKRWLARADFQRDYRAARLRLVEGAVAGLQRASGKAVATLERALDGDNPGVGVRAAQ